MSNTTVKASAKKSEPTDETEEKEKGVAKPEQGQIETSKAPESSKEAGSSKEAESSKNAETAKQAEPKEPEMVPRELTLIVAATNRLGIGYRGTLPWTGLKNEMAYFARVTKRAKAGTTTAVIMGRKTWDSIPARFRPLVHRENIVVTHNPAPEGLEGATVADSMETAIKLAGNVDRRIFVIGGAQIYKQAFSCKEAKRILFTRILNDYECDTWFPIMLNEETVGWQKKTKDELDQWVGEKAPAGIQDEHGTKYVFEMWEKVPITDPPKDPPKEAEKN